MSSFRYLFDHLPRVQAVLSHAPLGLISDVDGTISPIAPSPEAAQVSPVCAKHLAALAHRLDLVAAVSGRPAAQVRAMVGVEGAVYVGVHGLEWWGPDGVELATGVADYLATLVALRDQLATTLNLDGVVIEDKRVSIAIHYRQSRQPEAARRRILEALSEPPTTQKLRVAEGRRVIEVRPPIDVHKGTATSALIDRYRLRAAIYLGDDLTDVDAFRALRGRRGRDFDGLAVGVLSEETPPAVKEEADLFLDGIKDVERFLQWLAERVQDRGAKGGGGES